MPQAPLKIKEEDQQGSLKNVNPPEKTERILAIQRNNSDTFNSKNLSDEKVIGYGEMTTVKRMLHKPTNTVLAVKTWDFNKDDHMLKKIKEEFADLSEWDCKYVIKVLGSVCEKDCIRLFLEYVNKGSLADILEKLQIIPECVLGIIGYQCLKGLEYIHTVQNKVYRELKPSNILINSDGDIKLAEVTSIAQFELMKRCFASNVNSLIYLSPEAMRGEKYTKNRDVWSLGIILLECALGVNPYRIDSPRPTFFDIAEMVTKPIPALPDSFSEALRDFISKCLVQDLNFRPDVRELLKHKFIKKGKSQNRELFKAWLELV